MKDKCVGDTQLGNIIVVRSMTCTETCSMGYDPRLVPYMGW